MPAQIPVSLTWRKRSFSGSDQGNDTDCAAVCSFPMTVRPFRAQRTVSWPRTTTRLLSWTRSSRASGPGSSIASGAAPRHGTDRCSIPRHYPFNLASEQHEQAGLRIVIRLGGTPEIDSEVAT